MSYIIKLSLALILLLGCVSNGHRPNAPLCSMNDDGTAECTDSAGYYDADPMMLMCTTVDGYSTLERYIDSLEKEIKTLKYQLRYCN